MPYHMTPGHKPASPPLPPSSFHLPPPSVCHLCLSIFTLIFDEPSLSYSLSCCHRLAPVRPDGEHLKEHRWLSSLPVNQTWADCRAESHEICAYLVEQQQPASLLSSHQGEYCQSMIDSHMLTWIFEKVTPSKHDLANTRTPGWRCANSRSSHYRHIGDLGFIWRSLAGYLVSILSEWEFYRVCPEMILWSTNRFPGSSIQDDPETSVQKCGNIQR